MLENENTEKEAMLKRLFEELIEENKGQKPFKNSENGLPFHFQDYWDCSLANPNLSITLNGDGCLRQITKSLGIPTVSLLGNFSTYSGLTEFEVFKRVIQKTSENRIKEELKKCYSDRVNAQIIDPETLSFKEFFRGYLRMLAKITLGVSLEGKIVKILKKRYPNATIYRAPDSLEAKGIDVILITEKQVKKYGSIKTGKSLRQKNLKAFYSENPVDFFTGIDENGEFRVIIPRKKQSFDIVN